MNIGIIGAGKVGGPAITQLIKGGVFAPQNIFIAAYSAEHAQKLRQDFPQCQIAVSLEELCAQCSVIILAVRPDQLHGIATNLKQFVHADHLVLSVVTGIERNQLRKILNTERIARFTVTLLIRMGLTPSAWYYPELPSDDIALIERMAKSWGPEQIHYRSESAFNRVIIKIGAGLAVILETLLQLSKGGSADEQESETAFACILSLCAGLVVMGKDIGYNQASKLVQDVQTKGGITRAFFNASNLSLRLEAGFRCAQDRTEELADENSF